MKRMHVDLQDVYGGMFGFAEAQADSRVIITDVISH